MKGASVSFFVLFVLMANLQNIESRKMSLEEVRQELQPLRKICIDKIRIDTKLVDNASKGNFASDRKLQCYYKCMLLNTKIMKNDKIVEKAFLNIAELMMNDEYYNPIVNALEHCRPITQKLVDGCELALEEMKCIYEFDTSLLLFP